MAEFRSGTLIGTLEGPETTDTIGDVQFISFSVEPPKRQHKKSKGCCAKLLASEARCTQLQAELAVLQARLSYLNARLLDPPKRKRLPTIYEAVLLKLC
jgi:hypothetical protein